ncbi:sulfate respiration complex protein HmcD [Fundidesulfovibrio terrae]|nr:hypothetical protein [Fundidesulfovibrio terrae]
MEFHVYHDFMVHAKGEAYILMGVFLATFVGWWLFVTGKEPKDKNDH